MLCGWPRCCRQPCRVSSWPSPSRDSYAQHCRALCSSDCRGVYSRARSMVCRERVSEIGLIETPRSPQPSGMGLRCILHWRSSTGTLRTSCQAECAQLSKGQLLKEPVEHFLLASCIGFCIQVYEFCGEHEPRMSETVGRYCHDQNMQSAIRKEGNDNRFSHRLLAIASEFALRGNDLLIVFHDLMDDDFSAFAKRFAGCRPQSGSAISYFRNMSRTDSRYIDANGLRLHAIGGKGPPLLLIHGSPQTCYQWRLVCRYSLGASQS